MDTEQAPYARSWVNRLVDGIEALPGPAWLAYAVAGILVAVVVNGIAWAEGVVPVGTFDPLLNSLPVYVIAVFGAIHYLDIAAGRAWAAFQPAARLPDDDAARIALELSTMPARPVIGWSIAGAAVAIIYDISQYGAPLDLAEEPLTLAVATAGSLVSFVGGFVLVYHTIRQLRLIGRLHDVVEPIDLLHLEPLHAFAGVTATTGVILLAIAYLSAATDPATFTNPGVFALNIAAVVLAVACFVVPLRGVHDRIAAEKSRRLAAANRRLDAALRDLDRRADERDLRDADAVNKQLASLLSGRDLLARIPTWPWAPETVRGFATALILPVVLWLTFRFLDLSLS